MDVKKQLKTREKVFYGLGDMGNNIAYGAVGFYFVFFLTDVAGLSPLWAGYVFLIVRVWNAACDFIMGMVSDHTKSRFGRRRPFLLYGAVPLGISFAIIWILPFEGEVIKIVYYTLAGILFNTLYSMVSIPYNALLPELSSEEEERTSISGYKMAFSFVGSLLSAMGVSFIVDILYPGKMMYGTSFPVMGRSLSLVLVACILLAFIGTKERVQPKEIEKKGSFRKDLKSLLLLREYKYVLGVFIFNMVAFDIIMALYIYNMKYALLISESLSSIYMAIPLVAAVLATPLWVGISNKIGKHKTYIIAVFYFLVPLFACIFLPAKQLSLTVFLTILIGIGISASQVLIFAILPDVVEIDEAKNGTRREGMIYGTTMLLYKVGSALMVAFVSAALGWFGYVESQGGTVVAQSAHTIFGIRLLMGGMPALCLLLTIVSIHMLLRKKSK
ncbi:MAG: glycoside/pentoside/hexuronide:cation symporter, family [Clostridiales bacterium]|nr:glycoside/pentoside/hexuronide:cation symporter, family [Clostridiales bacterium]